MKKLRKFQALLFVNYTRLRLGKLPLLRLTKGRRRDPSGCPIARSIDPSGTYQMCGVVNKRGEIWRVDSGMVDTPAFKVPHGVTVFARDFDRGDYKELCA